MINEVINIRDVNHGAMPRIKASLFFYGDEGNGNRRVLFYEMIPTKNYQAADKVIGKNNFEKKDYEPSNAVWPYSVKVSEDGVLAITDTQYYRVLIWEHWKDSFIG